MKIALTLVGVLLTVPVGAEAAGYTVLPGNMPLVAPLTAAPQRNGFTPAPVPNQDIAAPRNGRVPVPGEPEFSAAMTPTGQTVRVSNGHSAGSGFSEELQRRNRTPFGSSFAPGFALTVPLEK